MGKWEADLGVVVLDSDVVEGGRKSGWRGASL